jgi:hypothetical protein
MKDMTAHDRFLERQRVANERAIEMGYGKEVENGVKPAPDIADIIAGELKVSRGTAYDLMREALKQTEQPAAWVGLTKAEYFQIEKDMMKYYDYQHECKTVCLPEFARAIEAKLKEKNT